MPNPELPKKDYYRQSELATAWGCAVEDIHHHFLHDRIKIGVRVHNKLLYGLNADLQTIGAYSVDGVLTVPKCHAEEWEFDATGLAEAGGLIAEPDYPPEIVDASHVAESSVPTSFFSWAPGCGWNNPETDHRRIERFVIGVHGIDENGDPIFDWRTVDPSKLVVHTVERERFERAHSLGAASAMEAQPHPKIANSSGIDREEISSPVASTHVSGTVGHCTARRVVVMIERREAIPVRALPFVLKWKHAMTVVRELARIGNRDFPISPPVLARTWNDHGAIVEVLPHYWKRLVQGRPSKPAQKLSPLDQVSTLPARIFLWRDEFERAFSLVLSGYPPPQLPLRPHGFAFVFEHQLDEDAYKVIMEGFEQFAFSKQEDHSVAAIAPLTRVGTNSVRPPTEAAGPPGGGKQTAHRRRTDTFRGVLAGYLKANPGFKQCALPQGAKRHLYDLCQQKAPNLFQSFGTFERSFWQSPEREGAMVNSGV